MVEIIKIDKNMAVDNRMMKVEIVMTTIILVVVAVVVLIEVDTVVHLDEIRIQLVQTNTVNQTKV